MNPEKNPPKKKIEGGLVIPGPAKLPESSKATLLDDPDFFNHCVRHYGQMSQVAIESAKKALASRDSPIVGSGEEMMALAQSLLIMMNSPLYFEWERFTGKRKPTKEKSIF